MGGHLAVACLLRRMPKTVAALNFVCSLKHIKSSPLALEIGLHAFRPTATSQAWLSKRFPIARYRSAGPWPERFEQFSPSAARHHQDVGRPTAIYKSDRAPHEAKLENGKSAVHGKEADKLTNPVSKVAAILD